MRRSPPKVPSLKAKRQTQRSAMTKMARQVSQRQTRAERTSFAKKKLPQRLLIEENLVSEPLQNSLYCLALDFCANGIFGAICQNLRSKVINGPKATFCMNIVSFFFTVFAWRFLFAFVEMPMGYWLLYRQCPISFIVCLK